MSATDIDTTGFINVGEALTSAWPEALPQLPEGTFLDHLWAAALESEIKDGVVRASARLLLEQEFVLSIPGLDAVGIAIAAQAGGTVLPIEVTVLPDFAIKLGRVPIALRLSKDLLQPAVRQPGDSADAPPRWVADTTRDHVDIRLAEVGVTVTGDGDIDLDFEGSIDLPPCMIGDSGVVVEAHDISLHLSAEDPPPGQPAGWKGIHLSSASLYLPGELSGTVGNLSISDAYIGNGGFTGAVTDTWTPALSAQLFGMEVTLASAEIDFVQNSPVTCALAGTITLPFFDQPVGVDMHVGLDGSVGITVSAVQPAGATATGGLLTLEKAGVLSMQLDSLGFHLDDGVFTASLSGTLTPDVGGIDWPGFKVQELAIDSDGNVRLEGGWLDLPSQYSLDFFGFTVAITRLGMGKSDDGGKWVGFSGSIKLVDGLGIGGSVDGLRFTWYDDPRPVSLTLDGVGVELEIPETLRFKGSVSYHELPGPQHRFDGDITLELLALDLRIDGKIVIGTDTNPATGEQYSFFALYIGVELPAGIPLWATGLGLYGIAGLVAIQMAPNKGAAPNALHPASHADEEWFENADGSPGWYKRPTVGVTDLRSKWDPVQDGFALGGGVTIGTVADNGFTFNGNVLLVVSFPGPVILLEGKANLLKERSSLADDPLFRALVVLDFRAGNLLVGLDAKYKVGSGGELIEIGGSAEAFFDFNDASRWHLYLGEKDPKAKRIRAQILSLFEANSYFMIDAESLQMGSWVGYDKHWNFGPLSVGVEAWIEGGVLVSWKPIYFHGELWLHGKASLHVFGFGLDLSVDARFAADVFDPFHVRADFSVGISLPWPLPDFDVDITLEWGPTPDEPPLPVPLKEIAVEHFKSTASWPLPRGSLLLPSADAGDGFLVTPPPAAPLAAAPPSEAPVVPMDARPHLTFGRSVHDDALVGVNPQPVLPGAAPPGWERIGDPGANQGPMRVRFAVKEIVLSKWDGGSWADKARKAAGANPAGVKELFGSWAPLPQLPSGTVAPGSDPPVGQTKLWLWSKTPFDYSRHGGRAWDEWFTDTFDGYPCIPPVPERTVCCDFDKIPPGTPVILPQPCRDHSEVLFVGTGSATVETLASPSHGHTHALCWDAGHGKQSGQIRLSSKQAIAKGGAFGVAVVGDPAARMELVVVAPPPHPERTCVDLAPDDKREVALPYEDDGMTVRVFDEDGEERKQAIVAGGAGRRGIDISGRSEITLPCDAQRVEVTLVTSGSASVLAFDADGHEVASAESSDITAATEVTLEADHISTIRIDDPKRTLLVRVCWECGGSGEGTVDAMAVDAGGGWHGPYPMVGDTISVEVEKLRGVLLRGAGHVCLVQVCVTFPPDGSAVAAHEDMAERLEDSMALFGAEGEVLEPNGSYRIKVVTNVHATGEDALAGVDHDYDVTDLAYFRTQGPPALAALSTPVHHPPGEAFESGLDDLTRYVRQTVPPTVPARGEQPQLPRPVYRAYDVGVVFNEDYVDLLYRLARRDLLVYLFDSNNSPARDADGRLIVSANRWGVTESLTLTESAVRYLSVIDQATCVQLDPAIIPRQVTLFSSDAGQVLEPGIVHEARVIPLLMHEDFSEGLGACTVVAAGSNQGPPAWSTLGHAKLTGSGAVAAATTVTLTGAGSLAALDPATDVVILSTDTARASKTYRVVSVNDAAKQVTVDGSPALFGGSSAWTVPGWGAVRQASNIWGGGDDAASAAKPGTMLIAGDPAWTSLRFTVQLRSSDDDAIGVVFRYQGPNDHYRFSMDRQRRYRRLVRIVAGVATVLAEDDFVFSLDQDYVVTVEANGDRLRVYQDGAPIFDAQDPTFATGRIGLYCWANVAARFADVRVDDLRGSAPVPYRFSFTTSGFANFHHQVHSFQDETWNTPAANGDLAAEVAAAVAPGTAPGDAEARAFASFATKVLGPAAQKPVASLEAHRVSVGGNAVALLVRSPEPIDWARTNLDVAWAPGAGQPGALPGIVKLTDVAAGGGAANDEAVTLLARDRTRLAGGAVETLGIPGPLPDDGGQVLLDDDFAVQGGLLMEQAFSPNALDVYRIVDAPGAQSGPSQWTVSGGAIHQTSNVYAGPVDAASAAKPGTVALTGPRLANFRLTTVLRSSDDDAIGVVLRYDDADNWYRFSMDHERSYRRFVKCVGGNVTVLWEDGVAYDLNRAYELRIDAYGDLILGYLDHVLLFAVRDGEVHDGQIGLYCWANVGAGFEALRIESLDASPLLWQPPPTAATEPGLAAPGTLALLERSFGDLELSLRLRSSGDRGMGVAFRYVDDQNWYRFSMDRQLGHRRLEKCVAGTVSILWHDAVQYEIGRTYALTVVADGRHLRAWIDGIALFNIDDAAIAAGRIGLYASANPGAQFENVVVCDPSRRVGAWRLVDTTTAGGPSRWRATGGALQQTSNIGASSSPAALGTVAVGGDPSWEDFRATVRMRSDDDDAIGVAFRWRDARNHYRLSFDHQRSYRRLVRVQDGAVTVLWQDAGGYTVGVPFTVTVDALGDRLVGRQGDELMFDVTDSAHPRGQVGLYSWVNTGARFERITVERPPLDAYARFRDGFGGGDVAAWTFVDEGTQSAPSSWAVSGGELVQSSNIYSDPVGGGAIEKRGAIALAGDPAWADLVLRVRLRSTDDDAIGVLLRYQDANNFLRFSMDRERGYRRLVRCAAGTFTTLWEDAVAYEVGRAYDLVVAAVGGRISGWLDGAPLFEVDAAVPPAGRIGLYCWANQGARFSAVRVYGADRLSSQILAEDDFGWETAGLWRYVVHGDQSTPAAWETTGGELRQTSNVWGGVDDHAELRKPGTMALAGDEGWTDYRVTARLRSDDDDAIGVVARYVDADNWYRFSMDRQRSYRRLVKCVGGNVTELWSDSVQYAVGREYLVSLDVVGDAIAGYVDGVRLFSVRDPDLSAGAAGVYCWANVGARFSSIRVRSAGWSTHLRFGIDEPMLAAGTRVVVHSGNESDWTAPPEAGVARRFLAKVEDAGQTRLPSDRPVALRLRTADGETGHARAFLPGGAYTALAAARLLRRADGLEFALVLPGGGPPGSHLAAGEYRLRLTYRRDNTAADPASPVLSQAGDSSDEVATLRVTVT